LKEFTTFSPECEDISLSLSLLHTHTHTHTIKHFVKIYFLALRGSRVHDFFLRWVRPKLGLDFPFPSNSVPTLSCQFPECENLSPYQDHMVQPFPNHQIPWKHNIQLRHSSCVSKK
jgi:hypothetical protein